jgi:hypothetical protein
MLAGIKLFARCSQGFGVVENERRIHQHLAVVAHQRWCFDNRIDLPESFEGGEDRNRPVFEGNPEKAQRDCGPAHVGRIQHTDELHGSCCRMGVLMAFAWSKQYHRS